MAVEHPYFPRDLLLLNFRPNDKSLVEILIIFFGASVIFLLATWFILSKWRRPRLSRMQRLVLCWFVVSGLIHVILEGYFALFHSSLPEDMTFLGQLWKEYGKGDSRYISSDPFVVSVERITAAVDGPLCFLTVILYLKNSPWRHIVQLVVSLCQLYGDTLYFLTEIFHDFSHGPIYHPLYFWFYFVTMNFIWIIVPFCLIIHASVKLAACQKNNDELGSKQRFFVKKISSKKSGKKLI